MTILHVIIILITQHSYACATPTENVEILNISDGMYRENKFDEILNFTDTQRGCNDMMLAIIVYVASFWVLPFIVGVGIIIAIISFAGSSSSDDIRRRRVSKRSFNQQVFGISEKFIFSFINEEKLDTLTGAIGEAIEKASSRCY